MERIDRERDVTEDSTLGIGLLLVIIIIIIIIIMAGMAVV